MLSELSPDILVQLILLLDVASIFRLVMMTSKQTKTLLHEKVQQLDFTDYNIKYNIFVKISGNLGSLTNLKYLRIPEINITFDGFGSLRNLKLLDLTGFCKITYKNLQEISTLTTLTSLKIPVVYCSCQYSNCSCPLFRFPYPLDFFKNLINLQVLSIDVTNWRYECLCVFEHLNKMTHIDLISENRNYIGVNGFEKLSQLFQSIDLDNARVKTAGEHTLSFLRRLNGDS